MWLYYDDADVSVLASDVVLGKLTDEQLSHTREILHKVISSETTNHSANEISIREELIRWLANHGIEIPTLENAAVIKAQDIAKRIVKGELTPYEGARFIWIELSYLEKAGRLTPFVADASEYEDCSDAEDRFTIIRDIVAEAELLLKEGHDRSLPT